MDVLAERSAETLAAWLVQNPTVTLQTPTSDFINLLWDLDTGTCLRVSVTAEGSISMEEAREPTDSLQLEHLLILAKA